MHLTRPPTRQWTKERDGHSIQGNNAQTTVIVTAALDDWLGELEKKDGDKYFGTEE